MLKSLKSKLNARGLDTSFNRINERGVHYFQWFDQEILVAEFVIDPGWIVNPEHWADEIFQFILLQANNYLNLTTLEINYLKSWATRWTGEEASVMSLLYQDAAFLDEFKNLENSGLIQIGMGDSHFFIYLSKEGVDYYKNITP